MDEILDFDLNESLGDEAEEVTAQRVLQILEESWINEKFSPEIMPHKLEYVECMLEQIKCMETNISRLDKNDIKAEIHKMELERIRHIITSFMRTRLKKIEKYSWHILQEEDSRSAENKYLTEAEYKFAREYADNMDRHLGTVLKEMPWSMRNLESAAKTIKPNTNGYVFAKAKQNIPNVIINDVFENRQEEITLKENSQHLLPYSSVADAIKSEFARLI